MGRETTLTPVEYDRYEIAARLRADIERVKAEIEARQPTIDKLLAHSEELQREGIRLEEESMEVWSAYDVEARKSRENNIYIEKVEEILTYYPEGFE